MGVGISGDELADFLHKFDPNNDGVVAFDEYLEILANIQEEKQHFLRQKNIRKKSKAKDDESEDSSLKTDDSMGEPTKT